MKLDKLHIQNFRNIDDQLFQFSKKINCIFGKNGNGKTNLLEVVNILATNKSFRKNTSFPQYLNIDGEKTEIIFQSLMSSDEKEQTLSCKLTPNSTEWSLDGKLYKRRPDVLKVVFINPFDSYNFHNTSSFRRNWFDQHFSILDPEYKRTLSRYNQSLRFKNSLLSKKPSQFREQISVIDKEIATLSVSLTKMRLFYLNELNPYLTDTFFKIFSEEHELVLNLESKVIGLDENEILEILKSNAQKDEVLGYMKYGVHKDDYMLLFDGINSLEFCSLGQQKMSFLSLLFAYISLFRYKFTSFPIVLIDDVSGELDQTRWKNLVSFLERSEFQVLITTANDKFRDELEKISDVQMMTIENGSLV